MFRPFVSSPHWTYSTFPAYSVKTQAFISVWCGVSRHPLNHSWTEGAPSRSEYS